MGYIYQFNGRTKLLVIPKQTVPCTPPLCRRGGWGVRLYFLSPFSLLIYNEISRIKKRIYQTS